MAHNLHHNILYNYSIGKHPLNFLMKADWMISDRLSPVFAPRGYLNPVPSVISLCLCTVPHLKCQRQEEIVKRQRGLHFRRIIIAESRIQIVSL